MIESAIAGLLLALLSWLFVSTINPDILYVRQPGLTKPNSSALLDNPVNIFGLEGQSCLAGDSFIGTEGGIKECRCYDKSIVPHEPVESSCQTICKDLNKCGEKFLVVKLRVPDEATQEGEVYTATSDKGGEIHELFLTNSGEYSVFSVEADHYLGSDVAEQDRGEYNCGILVTREIGADFDEHYIFWVREGLSIQAEVDDSLYTALVGSRPLPDYIVGCCGGGASDCDMNASVSLTNSCATGDNRYRVLRTRFVPDITNKCQATNCSLALGMENKNPSYRLNKDITCVDGYWQ